jgi:hypothetical protein
MGAAFFKEIAASVFFSLSDVFSFLRVLSFYVWNADMYYGCTRILINKEGRKYKLYIREV